MKQAFFVFLMIISSQIFEQSFKIRKELPAYDILSGRSALRVAGNNKFLDASHKNDLNCFKSENYTDSAAIDSSVVKVEALTTGPNFHWFGYYDKFQFDPSERYLLSMEIDFEGRWNTENDIVKIGMLDLQDNNRWIELGESRAWSWQQGCMLQWRPGSDSEILWNDREGDHFVCRILNVKTREMRTLPHPIYHISPDGKQALGTSFSRIYDQRQDYGYPGVPDPYKNEKAPEEITIYLLDLETGERTDVLSLADIARIRYGDKPLTESLRFNHIQWSPDGKRFFFLNPPNQCWRQWHRCLYQQFGWFGHSIRRDRVISF